MTSNLDIIDGPWSPDQDISHNWVTKMPDINLIEQGIPIIDFPMKVSKRNLDMEFRLIRRITESQHHNDELKDYDPRLNRLNRYNNILPYKRTEVRLEEIQEEEAPYINASFINSIHKGIGEKKFIATQGPLPDTFQHFWRMIWNEEVACIVMLCNLKENDKVQCDQYWPAEIGTSMTCGPITVTFEAEEIKFGSLYKRKMVLTKESVTEPRTVYQYQWSEWRDHGIPEQNGIEVIDELIEIMIGEYNEQRPSVVHCSAGVGRTGTLIGLVNLVLNLRHHLPTIKQSVEDGSFSNDSECEALKNCTLSVFGTVRRLREQRWGMVHHSEQYSYLHKYLKITIEKELRKIGAYNSLEDSI